MKDGLEKQTKILVIKRLLTNGLVSIEGDFIFPFAFTNESVQIFAKNKRLMCPDQANNGHDGFYSSESRKDESLNLKNLLKISTEADAWIHKIFSARLLHLQNEIVACF